MREHLEDEDFLAEACMKRDAGVFRFVLAAVLLVAASLAIVACQTEKQPIKVGFVGGLTGRYSDLGVSGRNGVLLAVEEANESGGIRGRELVLLTKDDMQDEKTAVAVDRELLAEGVVAIIGHMTSTMSVAAVPLMNENKTVMISPTATANALDAQDDFFIRMEPASRKQTESLARYAFSKAGLKRVAALYDASNRVYSEDYLNAFSSLFNKLGGRVVAVASFPTTFDLSFSHVVSRTLHSKPDGILLIAHSSDAAGFCQQIRKTGCRAVIISSGWAMTDVFLQNGGKAVEGVVFDNLINIDSKEKRYRDFKTKFETRFGTSPSFGAVHGYEAARLLVDALKVNDAPSRLKESILGLEKVYGLFGDFTLSRFGDPERSSFIMSVKNGSYQPVE
jgi:branched-chain amino acid transport system substrate-binding protein